MTHLNLGLETLAVQDILEDDPSISDFELGCQYTEACAMVDNAITTLNNCLAIQDHLEKFGSSEALKDLAGKAWEGTKTAGKSVAKAVKWLYEKVVAFFKWLGSLVARLFSKDKKKEIDETADALTKVKDIPVDKSTSSESMEYYIRFDADKTIKQLIMEYGTNKLIRSSDTIKFNGLEPVPDNIVNILYDSVKEAKRLIIDSDVPAEMAHSSTLDVANGMGERSMNALELSKYVGNMQKLCSECEVELCTISHMEKTCLQTLEKLAEEATAAGGTTNVEKIEKKKSQIEKIKDISSSYTRLYKAAVLSIRNADRAAAAIIKVKPETK